MNTAEARGRRQSDIKLGRNVQGVEEHTTVAQHEASLT